MFKDKVYEDMDDVSKMFEPFQYELNDQLSKFPDKLEITPSMLLNGDRFYGGFGADLNEVIVKEAAKLGLSEIRDQISLLSRNEFFKFEIEDLEDGDEVELNVETMYMSHKIFLIKDKIAFDEQELETMRKDMTKAYLKRNLGSNRHMNKARFNEVADIYGATEVKSERGWRGKLTKLCQHLDIMIEEKTLDIRDMALCKKFLYWIALYVREGNLAALNNLTRVKIITHEKRPIYSIEEKETK